jgi:hypothetical protein
MIYIKVDVPSFLDVGRHLIFAWVRNLKIGLDKALLTQQRRTITSQICIFPASIQCLYMPLHASTIFYKLCFNSCPTGFRHCGTIFGAVDSFLHIWNQGQLRQEKCQEYDTVLYNLPGIFPDSSWHFSWFIFILAFFLIIILYNI